MVERLTNADRRERRREAARKGAQTRAARTGQVVTPGPGEPPQLVAPTVEPPRLETAAEASIKIARADARRLEQLRAVLRTAQEIRRESDLYHLAHTGRWHHSPRRWTAEQIETARRFLQGFVRTDGTPQPDPIRRKGKWRL